MYKSLREAQMLTRSFDFKTQINFLNMNYVLANFKFADQNFRKNFHVFEYKPDYNYLVEKNDMFQIENPRSGKLERVMDKMAYSMRIPSREKSKVILFKDTSHYTRHSDNNKLNMVDLFVIEYKNQSRFFLDFTEVTQADFMTIIQNPSNEMKSLLLESMINSVISENENMGLKKKPKV